MALVDLSFCFWNARGIQNKQEEIENLLLNVSVLGVAETKLKAGSVWEMANFAVYRADGLEGRGGVLVLLDPAIPHRPVCTPRIVGLDGIALQVRDNRDWITLAVVYSSEGFSTTAWLSWLGSLPAPCIICGDLNAHHPQWSLHGSQNRKGAIVSSSLLSKDLVVLNDASPTFSRWHGGVYQESILDLVICTKNISGSLVVKVSDDNRGSDHWPLMVVSRSARKFFVQQGKQDLVRVGSTSCKLVSGNFGTWCDGVRKLIKKKIVPDSAQPLWWNEDCRKAICARKKSFRFFLRRRTEDRWLRYRQEVKVARCVLRSAKRSMWKRLCIRLSRSTTVADAWRLLTQPQGSCSGSVVRWLWCADGSSVLQGLPMVEALNSHFASVYEEGMLPPAISCAPSATCCLDAGFGLDELEAALNRSKDGAPGLDGISFRDIRCATPTQKTELLAIFNRAWCEGVVPEEWRQAILVPVPKAGRDKSKLDGYRPIALLPCACKLLEKMVANRLSWYLESKNVLHPAQYGFRRGRSAQDAVLLLESGVREAWVADQLLAAVFLDIKAAYDRVHLDAVWLALANFGISSQVIVFLQALFLGRSFCTRAGPYRSSFRSTSRGLPQGSALSPLLFVVVLDSILWSTDLFANLAAFADDLALWLVGPSVVTIQAGLQVALLHLEGLLLPVGLELAPLKTSIIVFRRDGFQDLSLSIGGEIVHSVREAKYLGVWLSASLDWCREVRELRWKIASRTGVLMRLGGMSWGVSRFLQRKVFLSFVMSVVDFHLPFIATGPAKRLCDVQVSVNVALRLITGCGLGAAVSSLHVEAGVTPLVHRSQGQLTRVYLRNCGRPVGDRVRQVLQDFSLLSTRMLAYLGVAGASVCAAIRAGVSSKLVSNVFPAIPPWLLAQLSPSVLVSSCVRKADFSSCVGGGSLDVFCDASFKVGGPSAVGIWIPDLKRQYSHPLPNLPNVMLAELAGISVALDHGLATGSSRIAVYSDSQSALRFLHSELQSQRSVSPLVIDIGSKLFGALQANQSASLSWVPGHSDVQGNVIADDLSRCRSPSVSSPITMTLCPRDFRASVDRMVRHLWEESWFADSTGRHLFNIHPSITMPHELDNLPKAMSSQLSQLRLGVAPLNGYLGRLDGSDQACICGVDEESVSHFLLDCLLFCSVRDQLLPKAATLLDLLGVSPHTVSFNYKNLRAVSSFCKQSGRL